MTTPYVNDRSRLDALERTGLMDSERDENFDVYTRLARRLLNSQISLISLVDDHHQFFESQVGLHKPWCDMGGTSLEHSICATVVETRDVLAIDDSREDPKWKDHPAVTEIGVVSYLGFPIRSPEGHILGSFCVINDHPRKWSDLDLETMNDLVRLLESKIRLRSEIAHRTDVATRLNETNFKLTEYTNSVKQILATIAHEIRTSLTSLKGHSEIARTTSDPILKIDAVNVIYRNTDHLLNLVDKTLEASRIDSGKIQFESIEFDPASLTRKVAEYITPNIGSKNIRVKWEVVGTGYPTQVKGDPTRIKQILMNLGSNAIKFTESGSVIFWTSVESRSEPDPISGRSHAEMSWQVIDTGPGMSQSQIRTLFKPYGQSDDSIHRLYGGSGLGLFISKNLAEAMGGKITVESDPGAGSRFTLTLPVEMPSERDIQDIRTVKETSEPNPKTIDILVAEDSVDIQHVNRYLLTRAGCRPVIVPNGREAVNTALSRATEFDLILMDVEMPELNGIDATRALREHGYRGLIFALTASMDPQTIELMTQAGCDECLQKPMDISELLKLAERGRGGQREFS